MEKNNVAEKISIKDIWASIKDIFTTPRIKDESDLEKKVREIARESDEKNIKALERAIQNYINTDKNISKLKAEKQINQRSKLENKEKQTKQIDIDYEQEK